MLLGEHVEIWKEKHWQFNFLSPFIGIISWIFAYICFIIGGAASALLSPVK